MSVTASRVSVLSDELNVLARRTTYTADTAAIFPGVQLADCGPAYWSQHDGDERFLLDDVGLVFHVFEVVGDCAITVVVASNANATDGVTVVTYPIRPGFAGELRRSIGAEFVEAARPDPSQTFVAIGVTVGGGGSIEFEASLAPVGRIANRRTTSI